jgi:hypothetical protein
MMRDDDLEAKLAEYALRATGAAANIFIACCGP